MLLVERIHGICKLSSVLTAKTSQVYFRHKMIISLIMILERVMHDRMTIYEFHLHLRLFKAIAKEDHLNRNNCSNHNLDIQIMQCNYIQANQRGLRTLLRIFPLKIIRTLSALGLSRKLSGLSRL